MSTVDPSIARKARQARVPSTRLVAILLVLHVVGGLGNGYGWSSFSTFADDATVEPDNLGLIGIVVGMPLAIITSMLWTSVVLKRRDVGLGYGFSAFWFGAGTGILIASERFPQAAELLRVLGVIALVICALLLALGVRAARSRRAAAEIATVMMRSGTRATATVTDKGYDIFRESARILTSVTFTFTDLNGVKRWVQRPMLITASDPVVDGQETDLWYDPSAPDNDKRIVVKLAVESPLR